ncbi:MAG: hypothetical protein GY799_14760 [Desulfobulbaceae bacterium]|nr:hypothetical protein [Desulfobulbaceae bacterium]
MYKMPLLLALIVLSGCSSSRLEAPFSNSRARQTYALYLSDEGDTIGRLNETVLCRSDGSIKSMVRIFHWEDIQQFSSLNGHVFKWESHKRDKFGKYELQQKAKISFNQQGLISKIKVKNGSVVVIG